MALSFSASTPEQLESIVALLQKAFSAPDDAPSLKRSYLRWKYYAEGPDWPGSRSYILAEGSTIAAHAVIWPVQLRFAGGIRQGACDGHRAGRQGPGGHERHQCLSAIEVRLLPANRPLS